MGKEISCAIMRDLLPNYIEKLTNEETNSVMENHFSSCEECSLERDAMTKYIHTDKVPENNIMENYLKKAKTIYLLKGIFLSIGIIGIIASFIVDIAINRRLTWSLIVDASVIYIFGCVMAWILSIKQKVIRTLLTASILILPFLFVIENVINKNFVNQPIDWFSKYALPITTMWIGIIWITILIRHIMKTNIWSTGGILLLLTVVGSAFTNAIARQVSWSYIFTEDYEWIDTSVYVFSAIVCFIIGFLRKEKSR